MNEYKVLIWHYSSKSEKWYDATENVVWYGDDDKSWKVKFANSEQYFHVSFSKMHVFDNPERVKFVELYYKNSPCFKVKDLICFDKMIYKIFYESGYTCVAFPSELKIVKDALKDNEQAHGVMAYYRRVVQETVHTEEDQFLLQQFDDINYVNEDSVLALYLKGQLAKNDPKLTHPMISPFGINLSQSNALKMMLSNRVSIIEGPPGTGKTQTILNFIANALINKKSVAVVSNNNSATDNVYEKLEKYGYSFIAAPLGNADNVDKFFEEYDSEVPTFEKKSVDIHTLKNLYYALPDYFANENNKKKTIENLNAFELEYKHFLTDNYDIDFTKVKYKPEKVKPENVLASIVKLKETNKKLSFWSKLSLRIKLKVSKSFFELNADDYVVYLNNLYYLAKIHEVKEEINLLEKRMNNQTLKEKMDVFTKLSRTYFENQLSSIFAENTRGRYARDNYKRQFAEFVKDYPVVLSSTYSLAKCSQRGFLFDYLIVDESSQVNMASAILSMRVAKNIIVVGDIKQLPQIDDDSFRERNEQLLQRFNVPNTYSYYGNSIMSSLLSLYGNKIPKTMLREHYRCNPDIISFCNKRFYNNELIIYTEAKKDSDYYMKVVKTTAGNFARKNPNGSGLYNQREIDEIKELLAKEKLEDVGVIAPYRYHTEIVMNQLGDKVDASTIHKFQGREKKTIIFSSVINDSNEFVENDNLINVAVSRAVEKFILVTSDKVAKSNSGVLSDLVNYISYNNDFGASEDGTVRSIYDLLYEDYQEQLATFRSRHPSKDFDSENLTKELLKKILANGCYSFGLKMHVSLKDFIYAKGLRLTDEEWRFFKNPHAHADFLIYNKMSRKPVLVIEVDGVSFHEQQKVQQERDAKKNSILEKAGIKLLRLKTNESGEEERIKSALDSIL